MGEFPTISDEPSPTSASGDFTTVTAIQYKCPYCGVFNSGKMSCCAREGAWFKKCGDEGDSKFDHTWLEGIQACNEAAKRARSKIAHERSAGQSRSFVSDNSYALHASEGRQIFAKLTVLVGILLSAVLMIHV